MLIIEETVCDGVYENSVMFAQFFSKSKVILKNKAC